MKIRKNKAAPLRSSLVARMPRPRGAVHAAASAPVSPVPDLGKNPLTTTPPTPYKKGDAVGAAFLAPVLTRAPVRSRRK